MHPLCPNTDLGVFLNGFSMVENNIDSEGGVKSLAMRIQQFVNLFNENCRFIGNFNLSRVLIIVQISTKELLSCLVNSIFFHQGEFSADEKFSEDNLPRIRRVCCQNSKVFEIENKIKYHNHIVFKLFLFLAIKASEQSFP